MKKSVLLFHIILMISQGLFAASQKSSHTFLFCLKPEFPPLTISLNRGKPSVGMVELDDYFQTHDVVRIEPWIKSATEMDRDADIYLNRIYRVYLDENRQLTIDQSISSIQDFPFLLYAEPEYIRKPYYTPNDPEYNDGQCPGICCILESVKADLAWDYWDIPDEMPGDENILLASVDTGVDYTHPDLIENIWVNQGEIPGWAFEAPEVNSNGDNYVSSLEINNFMLSEGGNLRDALAGVNISPFMDGRDNDGNGFVDDLIGWDASGTSGTADNDPFPKTEVPKKGEWAHGTHVAGILAATTNNGIGMASAIFNGKILSVKCSRDNSDEDEPPIYNGYDGITYAAKAGYFAGVRTIINCSWGGGGDNLFEQSVINNAFNNYGAIVVAAAGNGKDIDNDGDPDEKEYARHFPASYDNVVSVCMVKCSYNAVNIFTYHDDVDLAAPGENIYSTIIGIGYDRWHGSSMASPNAASVMGLVWSYYPEWSNEDVVKQVKLSADASIYDINPDYIDCKGESTGGYCLGDGMVDAYKAIGRGFSPNIQVGQFMFTEINGDNDGIINPGEMGYLTILLKNALGWADAENIQVELISENPHVTIDKGNANYGNIPAGDSLYNIDDTYMVSFSPEIELDSVTIQLQVTGNSLEYDYSDLFEYTNITVSINQAGFPVFTDKLIASPLVIDFDRDGNKEIIIGDNNGFVHIYNADGSEVENDTFPYDTGSQIWGSAAAADMDRDGFMDFVITSKSKHLYIFDQNGLKIDYNANKFLMGTPAIGNLDDDADLEVVVGGYSSSNQIFAVNPDGSDVEGFPFAIGERTKSGVALADFNENGKDDIVLGTDDSRVYLIYDDGSLADGFPYLVADAIQTAPSVLDIDGDKVIFVGTGAVFGNGQNNNLYAINSDGSLRFTVEANKDIKTSVSFLSYDENQYIFFGANDGMIYAVDSDGNALSGWPVEVNGTIGGSVVFSDLDGDGDPEIVATTYMGDVLAFHLDGSYVNYFPIANEIPFSGSPMITDLDDDSDLEIVAGSGSNLFVVDIKYIGTTDNYWNLYRGGNNRRGIHYINGGCKDIDACNYEPDAEMDDGTCLYEKINTDCSGNCFSGFTKDVCGVCGGDESSCTGCTDNNASNYNSEAIIDDGSCELGIDDLSMFPDTYSLARIYPNPFNPLTTIKYGLPDYVPVQIAVYDILGRQVAILINNYQSPGFHSVVWDASSFPSGLYFIRIKSNKFSETRKVLLIK